MFLSAIVVTLGCWFAFGGGASLDPAAPSPVALFGLRQPPEDPRVQEAAAAFEDGEAAYARGDYAQAVESFETAQRLAPHPYTEYNLALAMARDGRELQAWRIFDRLADTATEEEQRQDATRQLASLRTRLASLRVIAADSLPTCIDNARHAPGLERIVHPGTYRVTHGSFDEDVQLRAGEARVVDLRFLAPSAPQRRESPRAIGPLLGVAAVSGTAATGAAVVAAVENRDGAARAWTYTAAAASAVAVGTVVAALTLHFRSRKRPPKSSRRSAQTEPPQCPPPGPGEVVVRTVR